MNTTKNYLTSLSLLLIASLLIVSCGQKKAANTGEEKPVAEASAPAELSPNTLSDEEKQDGWILMFDGKTSNGWRGFKMDHFPTRWEVVDGTFHMKSNATEEEKKDKGDIIYDTELENFIFRMEWKIAEGGNSGIFYLGQELDNFKKIYHTAPEMQVLDNDKHPDAKKGKDGNRKAGSLYDLIPAVPQNARAVGEWNEVEISVINREVTHKQNGVEVVKYKLDSPEWEALVADSKFPGLNENWVNIPQKGYIGLQDHGDDVWFRNLRVKVL
ncbi:MAG: DUF1080 domain-containing protein [Cyclobacteriaceae bacterium]